MRGSCPIQASWDNHVWTQPFVRPKVSQEYTQKTRCYYIRINNLHAYNNLHIHPNRIMRKNSVVVQAANVPWVDFIVEYEPVYNIPWVLYSYIPIVDKWTAMFFHGSDLNMQLCSFIQKSNASSGHCRTWSYCFVWNNIASSTNRPKEATLKQQRLEKLVQADG